MLGFLFGLMGGLPGDDGAGGGGDSLLTRARQGDRQAREDLIKKYTPLVLRVAAQVTGRYVQVGRDDEVSVGLIALNEAIDRYDPARGAGWAGFAEMVVKRRLIDHLRKSGRRQEIPLSELEAEDDEGNTHHPVEERHALDRYQVEREAQERRDEIMRYTRRLKEFGVNFNELVDASPKHDDARERAIEAARIVARSRILSEHLRSRKELPLKALEEHVQVSRKTLERQRKYIIAVALLLLEDFTHLRSYIGA